MSLSRPLKCLAGMALLPLHLMTPAWAHDAELPLGDGNVSTSPVIGSVFACQTDFRRAGVVKNEPWIDGDVWYPDEKPVVPGAVAWPGANLLITLIDGQRVVSSAGLPSHTTGQFPIDPGSAIYRWDRNPNAIAEQDIALRLPANPQPAAEPSCLPMGMVGFALSGAAIFNALDAAGLDAAAHEVQDSCNGHPEARGMYHYHNGSECLEDAAPANAHSALVGYALDGFGIFGTGGETGETLGNADLDACHGHVHDVTWDGEVRSMYHYHLTEEYPYILGCFTGTPTTLASARPNPANATAPQLNPEPRRNQPRQPQAGGPGNGRPGLELAATTLGIDVMVLRRALQQAGPGRANLVELAAILGVPEDALRSALPGMAAR